jgi:UDP-N-acetylglucosamine 1-carboxyvinyltransferase
MRSRKGINMRIRVEGGQPLNGAYRPSGNTNAAIALLAAAMLTDQPVTVHNVPRTASTDVMIDLARWLGAEVEREKDGTVQVHARQLSKRDMTPAETHGFVGALLYIAPILIRRGFIRMEVDFPLNRISTHLEALRDLGQDVVTVSGAVEIRAAHWDYRDIILTQTSVTATEIALMLAAVLGKETIIRNAASEPHVQELCHVLELMGVQIEGIGSNMLHVFGMETLHGASVTVGPNYIEAASIAAMIALTRGRGQVEGTRREDLLVIERIYRRLGIQLDLDKDMVFVPRHSEFIVSNREEDVDSSVKTAPWPGFPSDLVAIAAVIATQARGTSLIHEPMFDNRLLFIDKLNAMGAQILMADPHRAIVRGPSSLFPIYMDSPDVRAGLGLLAAALLAEGETVIDNAQAISRSFEDVLTKLQALGAHIDLEIVKATSA